MCVVIVIGRSPTLMLLCTKFRKIASGKLTFAILILYYLPTTVLTAKTTPNLRADYPPIGAVPRQTWVPTVAFAAADDRVRNTLSPRLGPRIYAPAFNSFLIRGIRVNLRLQWSFRRIAAGSSTDAIP